MSQQLPKVPFEAARPDERSAFVPRPVGGPVRFIPGSPDPPSSTPPSLTYEPYYGLKEKAFSLSADPRFLYRSPSHAPAFEELLAGIRRREGLIVLTGEIGMGKTTLIRSVLQHLDRRTFTAFIPDPFVSREDLLKMLLLDFGVVSITDLKSGSLSGASRPDLSYPLYEFLDSLVPLQAFAVLIIDEAQNLPLPLLEEIRILSDLEHREKLLQVVLVGQPELRSHLKLPEMRQVDQRVSVQCELSALGLEDVADYVQYRLAVASEGDSRVEFSDEAIASVFRGSGGVPRVINLICDRALQRGHAVGATLIEPGLVDEAIRALGRGAPTRPAPVSAAMPRAAVPVARTQSAPPEERPARFSSVPESEPSPASVPVQILSEFQAETDLARRAGRRVWRWRLAASLLPAALAIAVWAAISGMDVTSLAGEVVPSPLPTSPAWTRAYAAPSAALFDTVDVDPVPPTIVRPAAPVSEESDRYAIQVASFQSRTRAERLVSELVGAGFQARAVELRGGSGGVLLQIRVDGYRTVEDAGRDLERIRELPGYADAHLLAN